MMRQGWPCWRKFTDRGRPEFTVSKIHRAQAYAAEEVGLMSDGDIAKSMEQVVGMMQFDMAMYGQK